MPLRTTEKNERAGQSRAEQSRAELTLFRGDCLEVMNAFPDGTVDFILSDLPFGITECSWDRQIELGRLWEQFRRVLKANGAVALFAVQALHAQNAAVEILHIRGPIYMIAGAGANITASVGPDGVLLVDTGTEQMSEAELAALATRDAMIGVAKVQVPATVAGS